MINFDKSLTCPYCCDRASYNITKNIDWQIIVCKNCRNFYRYTYRDCIGCDKKIATTKDYIMCRSCYLARLNDNNNHFSDNNSDQTQSNSYISRIINYFFDWFVSIE